MEPPKDIVSIQGRLALSNPMTSTKNLTTNVICDKCIIHNHSHHGIKWVVLTFGKYVSLIGYERHCVNEKVNHHDTNNHINIGYPILEWDFKQGIERMNVRCYVTLANTTHIGGVF